MGELKFEPIWEPLFLKDGNPYTESLFNHTMKPPFRNLHLFEKPYDVTDANLILKWSTGVVGATGMGKSNFIKVVATGLLRAKPIYAPMFFLDHTGELRGLYEYFKRDIIEITHLVESIEQVVVNPISGRTKKIYHTYGARDAEAFVAGFKSYYLDRSEFLGQRTSVLAYLHDFLTETSNIKRRQMREGKKNRPHLFIFDEIHNYDPEGSLSTVGCDDDTLPKLVRDDIVMYFGEMRKYGAPVLGASQRPARWDKDTLSQTNNKVILPLIEDADIDQVRGKLPPHIKRNLPQLMTEMRLEKNRGKAFLSTVHGFAIPRILPCDRHIPDLGSTPGVAEALGWEEGETGEQIFS